VEHNIQNPRSCELELRAIERRRRAGDALKRAVETDVYVAIEGCEATGSVSLEQENDADRYAARRILDSPGISATRG
jgi:hypothetical protein